MTFLIPGPLSLFLTVQKKLCLGQPNFILKFYLSLSIYRKSCDRTINYPLYLPSHFKVVMGSHFSEGGATQLRHDVTKGLVALLSHCCDDIASRQLLER